ncbi:hypothetical protein [Streptomyces sp. NRRL F-3307]|uniref:YxiG-like protein n=1 Tax=Streptomyces TaxID=1883 RepID=UPI003B640C0C
MATRRWSKALGADVHEVRMKTNAHNVTLLFSWDGVIRVMPRGNGCGRSCRPATGVVAGGETAGR